MAPRMTLDILRPESPRLRRGLAGAMRSGNWQAIAHRVYSMLDPNLLIGAMVYETWRGRQLSGFELKL